MTKKIAIIGAGKMAQAHLDVLVGMDDVEVVGVYSRTLNNAELLAKQYDINVVATSVSHLYEKTEADGVVIAVSENATAVVCQTAFQYPWKLLIEKPLGINLIECKKIINEAFSSKAEAFVALNRRNYGSVSDAYALLNEINDETRIITIKDQEAPILAR